MNQSPRNESITSCSTDKNQSKELSELLCANCKLTETELWCRKCEANYCSKCYESVHAVPILKTHAAIPINQKSLMLPSCSQHLDEKLKFWCSTCLTLICSDCMIHEHQGHACNGIENEAQKKSKEREDWFMKTTAAFDQVLKHTMELINANENSAIEMITKLFESIRLIVTKHENELKQKIHAIEKRNREKVEKFHKQLRNKQEKLSRANENFQSFLSTKDYTKLLNDHKESIKDLKSTAKRLDELKYPIRITYRIEQINQLQQTIADILQRTCVSECQQEINESTLTSANTRSIEFEKNKTAPIRGTNFRNIPLDVNWNLNRITVAGGNRQGNKLNQFNGPTGLYVEDDGTVYVADCTNHRVIQWKSGGKRGTIAAGGRIKGDGTHQLNRPYDVIVDKKNDCLIISDNGNSRVVRWSRRNHTASGEILISNISCAGLTMDENGSLYVVDQDKHEVRKYEINDTKGTVVAGGNGKGNRLDQLCEPWYIFLDQDHSLYVSDWGNHRVMKWKKDAKQGIIVAGGNGLGNSLKHLHSPEGIVVDQSGTVYVADSRNDRVMRWEKEATQGKVIIGRHRLSCPIGLSFDCHGNLYVVDWGNNRVQSFSLK